MAGLSGCTLLIVLMTIVFGHYYVVKLEEPYLERVFGREYLEYKWKTLRYVGFSKVERGYLRVKIVLSF